MTLSELCKKDVIQVPLGANLGRADDLRFDPQTAALEGIVLLWSGRPVEAEAVFVESGTCETLHGRALHADAWRDQGRLDEAITAYEELVAETAGTARDAVMTQHWGKALFVAGRYLEAARAFDRAHMLRVEAGAEASLIASSRSAAERARHLAE